ncbi:IS1 family transposase, partial [Algivirga pacifica]|uniref:IS1 family transposase n=1 Tax=Algivirga pacifica TaxID=1162670 RepID=UPI003CD07F1C
MDKIESEQLSCLDVTVCYDTEWDEFWSYVGSKKEPRWTWYLLDKATGYILAWENGRRQNKVLRKLLDSVSHLPIRVCNTDNWEAYSSCFPPDYLHIIGKDATWKIERRNLNFRTHIKRLNRKTICFSKNEKIHDNVIGMYINKF